MDTKTADYYDGLKDAVEYTDTRTQPNARPAVRARKRALQDGRLSISDSVSPKKQAEFDKAAAVEAAANDEAIEKKLAVARAKLNPPSDPAPPVEDPPSDPASAEKEAEQALLDLDQAGG